LAVTHHIVFLSLFTVRDDLERPTDAISAFHADIERPAARKRLVGDARIPYNTG